MDTDILAALEALHNALRVIEMRCDTTDPHLARGVLPHLNQAEHHIRTMRARLYPPVPPEAA